MIIRNAKIITENEVLEGYDLIIDNDRIIDIEESRIYESHELSDVLDAKGSYLSPGFIDIHSDYIEHMAAPRPAIMMDFGLSLYETERELLTHGITTIYHSLSLFKHSEFHYKPIRDTENVKKLAESISRVNSENGIINHKFHARFEIDNHDEVENIKTYIREGKVDLISFMDHTPGQGQYRDIEEFRRTLKGYNEHTEEGLDKIIEKHLNKPKITVQDMKKIADTAIEHNIPIASHDDDTVKKLDFVKSLGVTISEFPITLQTAKDAKNKGLYTIAGAPNVMLGGSHNGNLSASEGIANEAVDILCSDYYPPSLLHSVFTLHRTNNLPLHDMFKLITQNPAKAVGIDKDYGIIKKGYKADLLLIDILPEGLPVIKKVLVNGKQVFSVDYTV
jgi:alpha-D-ribose 1-methylphosphonate 5-triphosphate diphosphatase